MAGRNTHARRGRPGRRAPAVPAALVAAGLTAAGVAAALPHAGAATADSVTADGVTYDAPITISKGGTYSGNWQSTDPSRPAVTVATSEPVVIENANVRAPGVLIDANDGNSHDITVRGTTGYGTNADPDKQGRFLEVSSARRMVVEHDRTESTGGILDNRYAGARDGKDTFVIRYNRIHDVRGHSSAPQIVDAPGVPGIDIGWNQVVDDPYTSRVEDTINLYDTGGTATSPAKVHDNYIQGGYPAHPATDGFSGTGIITDGYDVPADKAGGYVDVERNQVVGVDGTSIAVAAGHHVNVRDNRMITSGLLADGTWLHENRLPFYIWNSYHQSDTAFTANSATGNLMGVVVKDADGTAHLNGPWSPDGATSGNTMLDHVTTRADEQAEYDRWVRELADAGLTVGPSAPAPTAAPQAPADPSAPLADGTYTLLGTQSGKALDVTGCSTQDWARIQIWPSWGGDCQKWRLHAVGEGYYTLVSVHSGKALDVSGASTADAAPVIQYTPNGGINQEWRIRHNDDGSYSLLAKHSGKALDVGGCVSADGSTLIQWPDWGGPCQTWRLTPA